MTVGFEIVLVGGRFRRQMYTVEFDDREVSELQHFLDQPDVQQHSRYRECRSKLGSFKTYGHCPFRHQSYAHELAFGDLRLGQLRIFTLRWGHVYVLGSGGVKDVAGPWQNIPTLNEQAKRLAYVASRVNARWANRPDVLSASERASAIWLGKHGGYDTLSGNLVFQPQEDWPSHD